jgi:predicted dinucleotide-binding enzyme
VLLLDIANIKKMKKTFGIIGAGNIGKTVARHLINAGFKVILSNSRGVEALQETITALGNGAKAGTPEEAATADIVILALPWSQLSTLDSLTDWNNRIVIDATNHFITFAPDFQVADLGSLTSSEIVQQHVRGAKLVKAFNTLYYKVLEANPQEPNGNRVIFLSGDSADAKAEVESAITSLGFAVVDLGGLATGGRLQQPKGALASLNLIKIA